MRVKYVDYNGLGPFLEGKKIIFFGAGAYLKSVEMPVFENHKKDVLYIVDNKYHQKQKTLIFRPFEINNKKLLYVFLIAADEGIEPLSTA